MTETRTATGESNDSGRVTLLVDNHRAFLRFLESRLGDRAAAEDVLQDAFARNLERIEALPEEAVVPWFYRVLKNAVIDRVRRAQASDRALAALAHELTADTPPEAWQREICACVSRLAGALKPEYAEALQAIDVDGLAVKTFAADRGLSANAAGVRVFRARQALRQRVVESCGTCADHGCVDGSCGQPRKTATV